MSKKTFDFCLFDEGDTVLNEGRVANETAEGTERAEVLGEDFGGAAFEHLADKDIKKDLSRIHLGMLHLAALMTILKGNIMHGYF